MEKSKETFNKFVSEMEGIISNPSLEPYNLEGYSFKDKKILEDIDKFHNHSWIKEIWDRRKKQLEYIAIKYRGQEFTYRDFFEQSYIYAKAMKATGLKKGDEFVCCIENTPEFPYIMGAASMIGVVVNLVSAEFDKDYLIDIIKNASSNYIFVSDMSLSKFAPVLKEFESEKKAVLIPLEHSLNNNNMYKELTEKHYKLDNDELNKTLSNLSNVVDIDTFLSDGSNYDKAVYESTELNDDFTKTYTSGSTGWGKPKSLIHRVRSYITMGRYHDSSVSGIPSMEQKTTMALIKTMSDTDFMTNVSDTFMQGGIVALEPINDKEYFLTSLLINKPTYAIASRSYWLYAMKQQRNNTEFQDVKLPFLLVATAVGEPLAANEEKTLNKWLRKLNTGTDIIKLPCSVACMSTGGGDSEHGGIFISIFRSLQSKNPKHLSIKEPIGMTTYGMVQIKALREDGTYCDVMEPGRLVANSPCNMKGYVNNPEANNKFFISDAYGKIWGDLGTYGYIDKTNHVYVKGRIGQNDLLIPNYAIADVILKDTKKILSCEVINCIYNNENVYVAHIEPQLDTTFNVDAVLKSAKARCINVFGDEIVDKLYFRIRNNEESFDLLHTGKRNNILLEQEGVSDKCIKATPLVKQKTLTKK